MNNTSALSFHRQFADVPHETDMLETLASLPEKVNETAQTVLAPAAKALSYGSMAYNLCKKFLGESIPDLDLEKLKLLTNGTELMAMHCSPKEMNGEQIISYSAKLTQFMLICLMPVVDRVVADTLPYKIFVHTPTVLGLVATGFTLQRLIPKGVAEVNKLCPIESYGWL